MTDRCKEEFEKWVATREEFKFSVKCGFPKWSDGTYRGVETEWQAFQAAYNLREKEIQRLREALEFYAQGEHWQIETVKEYKGSYTYLVCTEKGIIAKQALQQDLTTKE